MTSQRHTAHLWAALAVGNGLAIFYPIHLFRHANTVQDAIFAVFVILVVMGVLVVVDSICLVMTERKFKAKRSTTNRRSSHHRSNVIPFATPRRRDSA